MTLLTETSLPEELRVVGAEALLYHDIPEDTTAGLPEATSIEVVTLVEEMTFDSSEQEMELIWERSQQARLLKLYDKTSNLLDGSWMPEEKRGRYSKYLIALCDDVEPHYGRLNIIRIARMLAG